MVDKCTDFFLFGNSPTEHWIQIIKQTKLRPDCIQQDQKSTA